MVSGYFLRWFLNKVLVPKKTLTPKSPLREVYAADDAAYFYLLIWSFEGTPASRFGVWQLDTVLAVARDNPPIEGGARP